MKPMKFHPLCSLFPVLSGPDLAALAADIKTHGQREPILLFNGEILDGRNRFKACEIAGVKPRFKKFTGDDPAALVASLNLHRRHLTDSQRAMLAAELMEVKGPIGPSLEEAAKLTSTSTRSVKRARQVKRLGSADLKKAVLSGAVAVSKAAKVSHLPKQKQIAALTAFLVCGTRPPPRPVEAKGAEQAPDPNGSQLEPPKRFSVGTKSAALAAVHEVRDSMLGPYSSWDQRTVRQFAAVLERKLEAVL
jgi:hypothetical protein